MIELKQDTCRSIVGLVDTVSFNIYEPSLTMCFLVSAHSDQNNSFHTKAYILIIKGNAMLTR